MIYSDEINKVCALCANADFIEGNEESMHCRLKDANVDKSTADCGKFVYDIFKKQVRRKRRIKTDFTPEDFEL